MSAKSSTAAQEGWSREALVSSGRLGVLFRQGGLREPRDHTPDTPRPRSSSEEEEEEEERRAAYPPSQRGASLPFGA
eukprot:1073056-Prymnesium_polylepis.1